MVGVRTQRTQQMASWTAATDRAVIRIIEQHTNLMTALVVLGLCGWGIVTLHVWFVIGVIAVGAAAYLLGPTIALFGALVLTGLGIHFGPSFNLDVTTTMFELVGYALVARLGYGHRKARADLRNRRLELVSHGDQIVPWHVSNEIRTSLAAVRFLLFPVQNEQHDNAVEEAVKELARLERLFQEMEEERLRTSQVR